MMIIASEHPYASYVDLGETNWHTRTIETTNLDNVYEKLVFGLFHFMDICLIWKVLL